jgi:TPR repeat protein
MKPVTLAKCVLFAVALGFAAAFAPASAQAGPYEDGLAAVERGDYATALQLWRPLAEQGVADAQYKLGVMYDTGQGVPQDYAEAVKWYRMAAEQGEAYAQANLGLMYHEGRGLPQDYAEAAKWWRLAAEQGQADAQFYLGFMYAEGQSVPQDDVQAHMWYDLAASRHSPRKWRKIAAGVRDYLAARMTPEQIAEAQRLAREWSEQHQ